MRAALVAVAVATVGCGGGSSSPMNAMSATFSNLAAANTSGVAISTGNAACFFIGGGESFLCTGSEQPDGKGRAVTLSFRGGPVAGMDYRLGGPEGATVLFDDPTAFGTASGERQWQSVPQSGAIHVVDWAKDGTHVSFSYYGSMQPLGSPAAGSFDIVGDGNITSIGVR